ncbi:MAG TPA: protein-disulfide reductase DsbD family protein [Candidatus Ozemobacteraceae bacterium]|nr:protein-disulfide reductase DsbD family protein [Candidatus Ozemobacteraceae bacterium]
MRQGFHVVESAASPDSPNGFFRRPSVRLSISFATCFLFAIFVLAQRPARLIAASAAPSIEVDGVRLQMLSEMMQAIPGATATFALQVTLPADLHLYWLNPGDSGMPPSFTLTLPPGYRVGEIQWPVPTRHEQHGEVLYLYQGTVVFPFEVAIPASVTGVTSFPLRLEVQALLCGEECRPFSASLESTIAVSTQPSVLDPALVTVFSEARLRLPHAQSTLRLQAGSTSDRLWLITIEPTPDGPLTEPIQFLPLQAGVIRDTAPQRFQSETATQPAQLLVEQGFASSATHLEGLIIPVGTHTSGPFRTGRAFSVRIPIDSPSDPQVRSQ